MFHSLTLPQLQALSLTFCPLLMGHLAWIPDPLTAYPLLAPWATCNLYLDFTPFLCLRATPSCLSNLCLNITPSEKLPRPPSPSLSYHPNLSPLDSFLLYVSALHVYSSSSLEAGTLSVLLSTIPPAPRAPSTLQLIDQLSNAGRKHSNCRWFKCHKLCF